MAIEEGKQGKSLASNTLLLPIPMPFRHKSAIDQSRRPKTSLRPQSACGCQARTVAVAACDHRTGLAKARIESVNSYPERCRELG